METQNPFGPMLNSDEIIIQNKPFKVFELSALDYQDYQQYINEIERPIEPDDDNEATLREYDLAWQKINIDAHSRLAAYGLRHSYPDIGIADLQQLLIANFNRADIQQLHDKTAILSGFSLSEADDEKVVDQSESKKNEVAKEDSPNE